MISSKSIPDKGLREFQSALLTWYDKHKRDLPFRKSRDPYSVWVSEIMLQQTTVSSAVPYFERFIRRFPNVSAVAQADASDVLAVWQGLGYYSRARNFHQACKIIDEEKRGQFPQDFSGWRELPGIGDYTAAAISSIALNLPHAVIDGNVKRVLARLFFYTRDAQSRAAGIFFQKKSAALLHSHHPGDHNQAMMELGARVCRPVPDCSQCPVARFCLGRGRQPENIPPPKRITYRSVHFDVLVLHSHGRVVLERPGPKSLVQGLWQLPSLHDMSAKIDPDRLKRVACIRHSITNKKITAAIHLHPLISVDRSRYKTLCVNDLSKLPLGALTRKILHATGIWKQSL